MAEDFLKSKLNIQTDSVDGDVVNEGGHVQEWGCVQEW